MSMWGALKGKLRAPIAFGGMKGAQLFIELDEPYEGRQYAVMSDETKGRAKLRERLGRLYQEDDEITVCRFQLGSEVIRVLEVA